jgi:hypothetical protein
MKRLSHFFYCVLCLVLFGCDIQQQDTPTEKFNRLKPPITLFAKSESNLCSGCWGVELMDGEGKLHSFGNATQLGNGIGMHYNVGDTLK